MEVGRLERVGSRAEGARGVTIEGKASAETVRMGAVTAAVAGVAEAEAVGEARAM